jgi:nitrogen fixation/metabolism regulation signal transduction histidine kinase
MIKKLGKTITVLNAMAFAVVTLIGGVSIYFTREILHNAHEIQEESKHIAIIDKIHTDAYRLVLAMHQFLIVANDIYSNEVVSLISQIETSVEQYKAQESSEKYIEKNLEIAQLEIIQQNIKDLEGVTSFFEEYSKTGNYDKDELIGLEQFAYELEEATKKINQIHFKKISDWINDSLNDMWVIFILYVTFISLGGLTIYAGHRILLGKVARPIKGLVSATIDFAEGKLDTRVYTDSRTEIGQLYHSFNHMAEKLQGNDKILRRFNEELEKKVKERSLELQQANDLLQKTKFTLIRSEKIVAVGQIATGVTHEIKNPLNSLSLSTQILIEELACKSGYESSACEAASLIQREVNRINHILDEFVEFAKFPEPHFFINNINEVVSEVAELISFNANQLGIKMQMSLEDDIPNFQFDARQFKEVLNNIMQNALNALKSGGLLQIKTAYKDKNIIITLKDTGHGIPSKNLENIFTPFFSTKEEGLGLGLPIVEKIIESHGGKICCTSTEGEGTVFEIIVPVNKV